MLRGSSSRMRWRRPTRVREKWCDVLECACNSNVLVGVKSSLGCPDALASHVLRLAEQRHVNGVADRTNAPRKVVVAVKTAVGPPHVTVSLAVVRFLREPTVSEKVGVAVRNFRETLDLLDLRRAVVARLNLEIGVLVGKVEIGNVVAESEVYLRWFVVEWDLHPVEPRCPACLGFRAVIAWTVGGADV